MGVIQSSINSMIGSASHAAMVVKGYQTLREKKAAAAVKAQSKSTPSNMQQSGSPQEIAAQRARQSVKNAIAAKKEQKRRKFSEYLAKQPSSIGKVGDLPPNVQKEIAKQYSPRQRQQLMNDMDEEAKHGKYK